MTTNNLPTITEIETTYRLHHTAWARGYVSRKSEGVVEKYKGIYGEGYIIRRPSWQSSTYCHIEYYVTKI